MHRKPASNTKTPALLSRFKNERLELWGKTIVIEQWAWLEFNIAPVTHDQNKLTKFGFHWNAVRRCWLHPFGVSVRRSRQDPRVSYPVTPASALELNDEVPGTKQPFHAKEYKVIALRECPLPEQMRICDTPDTAADYWRLHVATNPYFNPEAECFVVILLNTRRRVKGHQLVTIGTMDTLLVHPREVFRAAVIAAASAIVIMHNHPSGDPTPSEADIKVTRDLIRAGQLMKIDVLDHVIMGNPNRSSLRELGYFF